MKRDDIPLWKQTMLTPVEYSQYSNLSLPIVYTYCNNGKLPSIKIGNHIKIHREEADKKLAEMALNHEGHIERHRAEEVLKNNNQRRRRKAQ